MIMSKLRRPVGVSETQLSVSLLAAITEPFQYRLSDRRFILSHKPLTLSQEQVYAMMAYLETFACHIITIPRHSYPAAALGKGII